MLHTLTALTSLLPLLAFAAPAPFYRFDVVNTTRYTSTHHRTASLHRNCTLPHNRPTEGCQVVRNCREEGQVSLTFDDGMFLHYETSIADTFGDGEKATFFLNGNNWDCIYNHADEIRALYDAGHTLGSHGWSHKHMDTLSWEEINDELARVEEAFIRILGVKPKLFRPPYGDWNDLLLSALSARNYTSMVLWNTDVEDGKGASVAAQRGTMDHVAHSFPSPHIVLAHSVHETSALQVTPYAVDTLRKSGYELVGMDTCLGVDAGCAYEYIGERQEGDWTC
ncbi:hypothetical protein NCC49_004021 [Naganishia albida]|nr:hypothetical protein NCC49_004021 [Naganishia albida]